MGLFSSLHEHRSYWTGSYSLKDPALNRIFGVGRETTSGIVVSDELAMTCAVVFAAVNVLASDIAKMPLSLMKRAKGGGSEPYADSSVYYLLKHRPNPEMGAMQFRQALTAHALTLGGGYAEIERNQMGRPVALWPITPDRICAKRTPRGALFYLVDGRDEFSPSDLLHIHGLGWDGVTGYALINLARQAIGLMLATEKYSSAFFGNNATFGGVISFDTIKDREELKEYHQYITDTYSGPERAFRLLLLDASAKFSSVGGSKNSDAQLNELRDKQVEEVSRFFRIPVHKVNSMARATFNNIEHLDLEYYKGPILDWATLWEQECNYKLIPASEQRIQFFKHNANVFLRGDIASRYQALGVARDKGVISANEWRELEDMNPQPGEQGNVYLVQSAQVPADKVVELAQAQIDSTKADAAAKANPPAAPSSGGGDDEALREALRQLDSARQLVEDVRAKLDKETEQRAAAEGAREAIAAEVERRAVEHQKALATVEALLKQQAEERIVSLEQGRELAAAKADLEQRASELASKQAELNTVTSEAAASKQQAESTSEQLHNLSVIEAQLRAQYQALTVQHEDRGRVLSEAEAAKDAALAQLRALADKLELAEAQQSAAVAEAAEARQAVTAAEARAQDVAGLLAVAEARAVTTSAALEQAHAEAQAAEVRAVAAEQARQAEAETLRAEAAEARRVADEREALAVNAQVEKAAADAALAEARLSAEAAQAKMVESERAAASALAELAAVKAELDAARAQVGTLTEDVRTGRKTLADAVARTLSERRDHLVETMRWLLTQEAERARRHQQTPRKLGQWVSAWYDGHAEVVYERILPHVRTHLAFIGSDEDAGALARELADQHVATSRAQIAAIADLEGDELAAALAGTLRRWESERATLVADRLMAKEVAHVREHR